MTNIPLPPPPPPTPIDPSLVEGALLDSFPGVQIDKSEAIGRRKVYKVEFSEFTLTVSTPETAVMKGDTTLMFRRVISFKHDPRDRPHNVQVFTVSKSYKVDDSEGLLREIRWARSYIMGIVMALSQAFSEALGSPDRGTLW